MSPVNTFIFILTASLCICMHIYLHMNDFFVNIFFKIEVQKGAFYCYSLHGIHMPFSTRKKIFSTVGKDFFPLLILHPQSCKYW